MQERILQVFYGNDRLPYKDKDRTIHYPIVGNTFLGSNNVDKIRFYVNDIGGTNNITWVLNAKLPNGNILYQVLSNVGLDSELNEYYVEFSVSQFYTQLKGDIYFALNGCDGEVTISTDDETNIQTITATIESQTILTTGVIKFTNYYAPQRPLGFSFDLDQYQDIISALSDKANIVNTIQVIANIRTADLSGFDDGQLFYDIWSKLYYKKISSDPYYELAENGKGVLGGERVVLRIEGISQATFRNVKTIVGDNMFVYSYISVSDFAQKEYLCRFKTTIPIGGVSSVSIYALDLENQCFYENRLVGLDDRFDTLFTNTYAIKLVAQTNEIRKLYGTDDSGNQITIGYGTNTTAGNIVRRDENGQVNVPLLPTENAHAASKKYVDDAIADFKENELQVVDTSEYPTLQDFLDTTGEAGYIYLYPIDTSDLTKGYYRYIWEDNAWLSLGTSEIDLSDYYTKTESDNKYVEKTNSSEKVYGTDELGAQTTYPVDSDLVGDGEVVRRNTSTGTVVVGTPTAVNHATTKSYVDSGLSGKQATLVSGTNIKTLNNQSLLGSGNYTFDSELDSSSTNAVQNKVLKAELDQVKTELNQLKLEFYEAVVSVETYEFDYFTYSAIPLTVNSQPVIFSAGMDMTGLKGRSYVVNQGARELNSTYWTNYNSSVTFVDGVVTFTASAENGSIFNDNSYPVKFVSNHKYLIICSIKLTTATNQVYLYANGGYGTAYTDTTTNWQTLFKLFEGQGSDIQRIAFRDGRTSNWDAVQIKNVYCIDLTQWFGSNDNIPADLLSDPSLFTSKYWLGSLSYDTGHLVSSQPNKVIIQGFNVWDEEWQIGAINWGSGENGTSTNTIRSKNYTRVNPNTTYYFKAPSGTSTDIHFYDINKNHIKPLYSNTNSTFTIPSNCFYVRFMMQSSYGATYNHDICINLSNATLNGTYMPYKAPVEHSITSAIIRSAGSAQDTNSAFNIGSVDLGTLNWSYDSSNAYFYTDLADVKRPSSSSVVANIICSLYKTDTAVNIVTSVSDKSIGKSGTSDTIMVKNTTYTDATTFKSAMSGVILYYELATPLNVNDMAGIDLGSLNWTYDSNDGKMYTQLNDAKANSYNLLSTIPHTNMYITGSHSLRIYGTGYTNAATFKTAMNGVMLYYELANPTGENTIFSLPTDINIDKGDNVEMQYASGNETPSDGLFDFATNKGV